MELSIQERLKDLRVERGLTLEHAAGMGQEAFSGRTAQKSKMEGTNER